MVRQQLLGNLRDIEANPSNKALQAEFLARRDILWDRMNAEDQRAVDEEHDRVHQSIKTRAGTGQRKRPARAAA